MRIISLSPSLTEILQSLGEEQCLVAVTDHCPEISERIPKVGSPKALKIAEIKALSADLILADQNENRPEEIRELQKQFKIVSFDVRSPQAAMDAASTIGRLVAKTEESLQLEAEIASELTQNKTAFQDLQPVRTVVLLWNTPLLTINFDTYISRLVEASGAYNIFHTDPLREFPIELEDIIEKEPELMLLPKDPFPFKKSHIKKFREYRILSKIPIHLVDGKLFSRFGPRTVEALQVLREIVSNVRTPSPS